MDDKNPLLCQKPSAVSNGEILNKRGRPASVNITKFGPQPQSIIAQMLLEMKTKTTVIEDKPTSQNKQPQDFVETNKSEYNDMCQTCSYRNSSVAEHKKCLSSHQQLSCDFPNCSYSCKLSSNLIKHKRVHTNEKPYLCDRCSFRTNFVNSLKAHKRIHTAEKPYQCAHCSYRCNSSSNLKKHCHLRHPDGNKCKYK